MIPRRIYLAARFSARPSLRVVRDALEKAGHRVTSRWIDEDDDQTHDSLTDQGRLRCAVRDLTDIGDADILIVDTLLPANRGGREVEVGYALGRHKGFFVVGPIRNVFHTIATRRFDNWQEALDFFCPQTTVDRTGSVVVR